MRREVEYIDFPTVVGLIEAISPNTANDIVTNLSSGFNSGTTVVPTLAYNELEAVIGSGIYVAVSVNVSSGKCNLYATNNFVGYPVEYTIPVALTLPIAQQIPNYLCAKLVNGVASYAIITDKSLINFSNIFPIFTIVVDGNDVREISWDSPGWGLSNKILKRNMETNRFAYVNGLLLSETGTRNIVVSSGKVWNGVYENFSQEVNSATDIVRLGYTLSNGTWTSMPITQYPNTQYDTGHGLATLTTGTDSTTYRYAVIWVYRSASNKKAIEVFLGNGDYTLEEAKASQEPAIPEGIKTNGFLVGRIIVKKGANLATQIDKAWSNKFSSSISSDHNSLTGKEGGGVDIDGISHYYHVSKDQITKLDKLDLPITNKVNATTAPTATDDNTKGYSAKGGSTWTQIDGENTITYVCTDDTKDHAVWVNTSAMFIFDTWALLVEAISVVDTTYIDKYVVVLNAGGGVSEGVTYTAPATLTNPIADSGSATYKVNAQGTNWSVTCKKHDAVASTESLEIVGQVKEYSGFILPSGHLWANQQEVSRVTYINLMKAVSIELTGSSIVSGSNIVTISLPANLSQNCIGVGQSIEGVGIPSGAYITGVTDSTHITISANATSTASTIARIFPWGNGDGINTFNTPSRVGRTGIGAGKPSFVSKFAPVAVNVSSNNITVRNNYNLYTGTTVKYTTTGTAIGGLTNGATYYVIRDSAVLIRLASSIDNSVWSTTLDLTSQGTGIHSFEILDYTNKIVGSIGGEEAHRISVTELAKHSHQIYDNYGVQNLEGTFNNGNACDEIERWEDTTQTGGSASHNNMQPYSVFNYIVKY